MAGSQSLLSTVSASNRKLFAVGLHTMNEFQVRCPEVKQADMRVVWFGGGLQGQMPLLFALYPDAEFEIHTQRACPVSAELKQNLKVSYHKSSMEECLRQVEAYEGKQKLAVLLDMDYHIKPGELAALNKANIPPTVESESVHYDTYTAQYAAACERLARCPHVVLVSMPFRLPWITNDIAENGHKARWLDARLERHEMWCPNMLLFPQFGSRVKSTELRGVLVMAGGFSMSIVNWHAVDEAMYKTTTETRELERAQFMLLQLELNQALATARGGRAGDEGVRAWADAFIGNSVAEVRALVQSLESANPEKVLYKERSVCAWSEIA